MGGQRSRYGVTGLSTQLWWGKKPQLKGKKHGDAGQPQERKKRHGKKKETDVLGWKPNKGENGPEKSGAEYIIMFAT